MASRLFTPIDIASLVYFRIVVGIILFVQSLRYLSGDSLEKLYLEPKLHFTYVGFDWVQPWPGVGLYLHMGILAVAALAITFGLFYRIASAIYFLGFTYIFLLEKARYLNHFYLVILLCFLLIILPAHRALSVDVVRKPNLRSSTVPAWTLWLLRAQISIVYFYAGLAKLNVDWLRGEPLRDWLSSRSDLFLVGPFLGEEWCIYLLSYGGLALDLFAAPLLLWRRTRILGIVWVTLFHCINFFLFNIGIFPWLMLATTLLFLDPSWPRGVLRWFGRPIENLPPNKPPSVPPRRKTWITAFLLVYLVLQLTVPLRHFLYPGNVAWTEEGHRFSWRMKLRTKDGWALFTVKDPSTGEVWTVDPRDSLSDRQYSKMTCVPDMVIHFAHQLAEEYRRRGIDGVEVRARVQTNLNSRGYQLLVDPDVDLAAQPRTWLAPASWILPLRELKEDE